MSATLGSSLHWIDWLVCIGLCLGLVVIAWKTRTLTRSVAGFISAERCAGRYLLTMAGVMAFLSTAGYVSRFQEHYQAGFTVSWWYLMTIPAIVIMALSGWVLYRYRQTRALTLGQFLEMRYSRRFRIYAACFAFVAGILNAAIFPMLTARFVIYFGGLPESFHFIGFKFETYPVLMFVLLSAAVGIAISGGQVTIMVTDFIVAMFVFAGFLGVGVTIVAYFGWSGIMDTLISQAPEGQSMINPFNTDQIADFNVWFYMIMIWMMFYGRGAWQGGGGYQVSARSPHEARMSLILGTWREQVIWLLISILPVGAWVLMHHPGFVDQAQAIQLRLDAIGDADIIRQVQVPVILGELLPIGLSGLLVFIMVGSSLTTDDTYYHSWGNIFIQDIVLPLRKKRLSNEQHLLLLRLAIVGIGLFCFFWSWFVPLRLYVSMWFQVTAAIFIGGAGCAVIGGLYWNRGTTAGAYTGLTAGSFIATVGMLLNNFWSDFPMLQELAPEFPLNGAQCAFAGSITAILLYVGVSLATCKKPHDMDKLLHRGRYAVEGDHPVANQHPNRLLARIGISDEFSRGDIAIYVGQILWTAFWIGIFILGTVLAQTVGLSDTAWANWWGVSVGILFVVACVIVVWFTIGGAMDLRYMLKALKHKQIDYSDDGTVNR